MGGEGDCESEREGGQEYKSASIKSIGRQLFLRGLTLTATVNAYGLQLSLHIGSIT